MPGSPDVTQLLLAWSDGDDSAMERLAPLVYAELHRLAKHYRRLERPDHTLQTTAIVNEAYLKLIDARRVNWQNRSHFFGISARLMRQILVDFARRRNYSKRGGGRRHAVLEAALHVGTSADPDLVALDDALQELAKIDERKSRVVELRFFGGLNTDEIGEILQVSPETVRRDWRLSKAWLRRQLSEGCGDEA